MLRLFVRSALISLCLLAVGCTDPAPASTPSDTSDSAAEASCGTGQPVEVGGSVVCVFPATETGFSCPPDMFPFSGGGWEACAPNEGVSGDEIDEAIFGDGGLPCGELKVDVLLVIDPSSSMCDEQNLMVESLQALTDKLDTYDFDIRVAATGMDMLCDPEDGPAIGGRFNDTPAKTFAYGCGAATETAICDTDADCASALGGKSAQWNCVGMPLEECRTNPNGTVNTLCSFVPTSDADCKDRYGDGVALVSAGSNTACVTEAETAGCPDKVGPVLEDDELSLLPCLATLPPHASNCYRYEQGLAAAWAALDPNGPNAPQALTFLREDALLVLVFASDEDDCSVADGHWIDQSEYNLCGLLGDTTEGGPLEPVSSFADKFRSLKPHPAMVSVLSVVGDSVADGPSAKLADREAYVASKTDPYVCHQKSYICEGDTGKADWGRRYQELAKEFDEHGLVHNLCRPRDMSSAVVGLVDKVKAGYLESCGPPPAL